MANRFDDILSEIKRSVKAFQRTIPATQRAMYDAISIELRDLDLNADGFIKPTVKNLKVIRDIKSQLQQIIVSPEYIKDVRLFVESFNTITELQNEYWKGVEKTFKPKPILRQIRTQTIRDTVQHLTTIGIEANVTNAVSDLLKLNITTGGSYKSMQDAIGKQLLTTETPGLLEKFTTTITKTALNQYNRQYTQTTSNDLGFEWNSYQGSEIETSRGFCQAMVENNRYFHISQVPLLLQGKDALGNVLRYHDFKTGVEKTVTLNPKTNLPSGFIEGTNMANFYTNAGGWGCQHQPRPVPERNVPVAVREQVYSTDAYKRWKGSQ